MSSPGWGVRATIVGATLGALALAACPGTSVGTEGQTPPMCDDEGLRESISQLQLAVNRDVDILFVIDNSGTMAEEQARLVASAGVLLERLDELGASYHIAFTTTDRGNPWCPPATTTPEAGNFVLSPCTTRLAAFLYNNGTIDAQDLACNDLCALDEAALTIAPTTTDLDDEAVPRPWLERIEGVSNLPASTDMAAAFACFAPQGIDGCGFELPLESMYLGLQRARDPAEDELGFLRASAVLAVVILTDEFDCSHNPDWAEIFDGSGDKAFWSDPEASYPSSALCWNAGVSCTGDPSAYDSCEPANYALGGAETSIDADAVLHPLSRYAGLLDDIEAAKRELDPGREIIVSVIAGVEGSGADWSVSYAESDDIQQQLDFGIGPGCVDPSGDPAMPPVRMRALAEDLAYGDHPPSLHSVCAPSYDAALAELGERVAEQMPPACYTSCPADSDLSTPQLEPDCWVEQHPPGNSDSERVAPCVRDGQGHWQLDPATGTYALPEGLDVCYATRVDPDGSVTPDPHDDLSPACTALGSKLEFALVRREGVPAPGGTAVSAHCEDSPCPEDDCPDIGR